MTTLGSPPVPSAGSTTGGADKLELALLHLLKEILCVRRRCLFRLGLRWTSRIESGVIRSVLLWLGCRGRGLRFPEQCLELSFVHLRALRIEDVGSCCKVVTGNLECEQ